MPVFLKYGDVDLLPTAVNHGEFKIVKLLDATSPMLDDSGGDGRTSGPVDDLIGWDFCPGDSQAAMIGGDGIDLILDLGGADGSSPDAFPTETIKMTYGAIEWTYAKDTGGVYGNPSSFQINSAGADDMGRSFDLIFPTQTAFEQREGNAVATESLEIAHEGFLGDHDDGWCMAVEIDFPESVHALYDLIV
jgi:hypothetical protein